MSSTLLRIVLPLLVLAFAPAVSAASFEAGKHYTVISENPSSDPLVQEFFSYGCGACYSFEPFMKHARVRLGDKAEVQYVPVDFGGGFWTPTQQLFLVLDALGRREQLQEQVFQYIHGERRGSVNARAVREFANRHGISNEQFDKTLKSFAVHTRKQRYDQLTKRYRIQATPTVIVNGKYRIDNNALTTPEQFVDLVEHLLKNP